MKKLGLVPSVADWIEARNLRNQLVHEYMRDAETFAAAINQARSRVNLLVETYNNLRDYIAQHLVPPEGCQWPDRLG